MYGRITHTLDACIDDDHPYQYALGKDKCEMVPIEELEPFSLIRMMMNQESNGRGAIGPLGRETGGSVLGGLR